jgi:hypothetical protein
MGIPENNLFEAVLTSIMSEIQNNIEKFPKSHEKLGKFCLV